MSHESPPSSTQEKGAEAQEGEQSQHEQEHTALFFDHFIARNPHLTDDQRKQVQHHIETTQGPWCQYDDEAVYPSKFDVVDDHLVVTFDVMSQEVIARIPLTSNNL